MQRPVNHRGEPGSKKSVPDGGLVILRSARIGRNRILIGSRFFVTLSPLIGQPATNSRQNMTYGPKNSDKSLRVTDLIDRLVVGK